MTTPAPRMFDPSRADVLLKHGHSAVLGAEYRAHGADWVELECPWQEHLASDGPRDAIGAGPMLGLADMACTLAIWTRRGAFLPQVTLDLRIDTLRSARERVGLMVRGECVSLGKAVAIVRGSIHDGDPADPVALTSGSFMLMQGSWR